MLWHFVSFSPFSLWTNVSNSIVYDVVISRELLNSPGTPAKNAFPAVCVRLFLHLLAVGQLRVVIGGKQFSLEEIRQRRNSVWNVASQQDAEQRQNKSLLPVVMLLRLSVSLPSCQLLDQRETLRILPLHSVLLRCTTGLRQLPGSRSIIKIYSLNIELSLIMRCSLVKTIIWCHIRNSTRYVYALVEQSSKISSRSHWRDYPIAFVQ